MDISIDILKRQSRRTIGLRITQDGQVEVRAPHLLPKFMIHAFVQSKRDWIIKTKQKMAAIPKQNMQLYSAGSVFSIAGKSYTMYETDGSAIVLAGSRLFFPKKFQRRAKYHMEAWCRIFAKKFLKERLDFYAAKMNVTYKKISIRDTSSRWGSCSSTGTISFSYRLVLAELPIIDYVVIHELAHVTHHHHKQIFWDRVGAFYPDYKQARTWLRTHGHTLHV